MDEPSNLFSHTTLEAPQEGGADRHKNVPSVSAVNRSIRGHLENAFFDVWVKGEISNFRKPASGHAYFVIKDAKSQMKAVMFRNTMSKIKFRPQDGMEVVLHGAVGVYEARGEYQIICDSMEPVGMGGLQLAFEQLKKKLQAEGLFEKELKKSLPFLPKRIGVVTSPTGAAVRDILKVLSRRFFNVQTLILPAAVQGDKAKDEIVRAIEQAEQWNKLYPQEALEVLIVGRGGGSLEDLWPFNEEIVARKIFECPIPIISAVGHEIDFTISDFVADVRAPTPSAAAEIVVPKKEELVYQIRSLQKRLLAQMQGKLRQDKMHLGHLSQRIISPEVSLQRMRESIDRLKKELWRSMTEKLTREKRKVENLMQLLDSLSPLRVLDRGYNITQDSQGHVVDRMERVQIGALLTHRVSDGFFTSKVEELKPQS